METALHRSVEFSPSYYLSEPGGAGFTFFWSVLCLIFSHTSGVFLRIEGNVGHLLLETNVSLVCEYNMKTQMPCQHNWFCHGFKSGIK